MQDNNLTSEVGGLILTLKFNKDKSLASVSEEWINFD
jgi:hypothetical protein